MRPLFAGAVLVMLMLADPHGVRANSCSGPSKPVSVSGRFCGRTVPSRGAKAGRVVLRLLDANGTVKATVRSDLKGRFIFPSVPKGRYSVDAPDWGPVDEITITGTSSVCRKRETLDLPLPAISCTGGIRRGLGNNSSSFVRGSGLPRQR
jgi:hypothetical protein